MTLEEIIQEIPFSISQNEFKTKEEFFAAFGNHLSILATKAEYIGDERLTKALDIMRMYLPKLNNLTQSENETWTEACNVVGFYTERFSEEGKEDEQMMKDEVYCACKDADEKYEEYLQACDEARRYEKSYRDKYGEPSGMMSESFYRNDGSEDTDDDDEN